MYRRQRQRGDGMAWILMFTLFQQIQRLPYKPPITLALVALQCGIFFFPNDLNIPSVERVCLIPAAVLQSGDVVRLLGSAFIHADAYHLYYNMVSFIWKGVHLEQAYGSHNYGVMIASLLLLSHTLIVGVSYMLASTIGMSHLLTTCAVGFSAVIFALKTVLNYRAQGGTSYVMGIPIPVKYAAWAELVLIQLITPQASFVGHLCGILAGIMWIYGAEEVVFSVAGDKSARFSQIRNQGITGNLFGNLFGTSGPSFAQRSQHSYRGSSRYDSGENPRSTSRQTFWGSGTVGGQQNNQRPAPSQSDSYIDRDRELARQLQEEMNRMT